MEESLKKNSMESTDSCGCGCGHDHHEEHEHEEHAHEEHHHHDDEHCGCGCEDHEHEHHHHDHDDDHCDCGCEDHEHEHHEHEHHHHHHDDDHCGCGCEDHDHEHHEHEHHHHHDDEHCGCGCGDHDHNHEHHEHSHSTASAKRVYILENLGCAHCASKMEEQIQHLDGVESATITFATKQLRLNAADPDALLPQIRKICTSIESEVKVVPRNPKPAASADVITKIYLLENLGCAHCASKMEEQIADLDGISEATITFATKQLRVTAKDPDRYLDQIRKICTSIESEVKVVPRSNNSGEKTKTYILGNLGCANCASKMEKQIADLDGISEATITFATKQLRVTAKNPDRYLDQIRKICTSIESEVVVKEKDPKPKSQTATSET